MIIVADTSPPLHLARIHRLDLLPAVVGRVTMPRIVWRELLQAKTRPEVAAAIEKADWIDVLDHPADQDLGLDPGETAAILLAERMHAHALLIDERRGRAAATARGIPVIGTLGIVAGARRLGILDRAAPVVAELRADGFWLSEDVAVEFLTGLGERP